MHLSKSYAQFLFYSLFYSFQIPEKLFYKSDKLILLCDCILLKLISTLLFPYNCEFLCPICDFVFQNGTFFSRNCQILKSLFSLNSQN